MRTGRFIFIFLILTLAGNGLFSEDIDPKGTVQNGASNRAHSRLEEEVAKEQPGGNDQDPLIGINAAGLTLQNFYLSMDVENNWLAGHHVNWETGQPDMPESQHGNKTHCSAFAAAVCKKAGVYLLSPPEHGQILLANAQFDWLQTAAAVKAGWHELNGEDRYLKAQALANAGKIVIAICRNADPKEPGHAALIMPKERTVKILMNQGPEIIMAGTHNHNYISLRNGFHSHIPDWPEQEIKFYVQELPIKLSSSPL